MWFLRKEKRYRVPALQRVMKPGLSNNTALRCEKVLVSLPSKKKPEREYGPKLVTAKYCCALLPSNKVDVNYIATSTFLRVHRPLFKAGDDKLIFGSYNRITYSTII